MKTKFTLLALLSLSLTAFASAGADPRPDSDKSLPQEDVVGEALGREEATPEEAVAKAPEAPTDEELAALSAFDVEFSSREDVQKLSAEVQELHNKAAELTAKLVAMRQAELKKKPLADRANQKLQNAGPPAS